MSLRLLVFSTLYPNAEQPNHGVFVENRLRHLVATRDVSATVIAPVGWFPSGNARFGRYARLARVPDREARHGLDVHHPRYPILPRIGMTLAPFALLAAGLARARALHCAGRRFDAIDAHYVYPDGVAAVWLGRRLGLPVVVTARGSDVSQLPQHRWPRRLIRGAIAGSDAMVAVSAALAEALERLGAPPGHVRVLRNGVDTALFRPPADRDAARAAFGIAGPTLLSVGHLIERKGHHRAIDAVGRLPGVSLLIAGEGPERAALEARIARAGLGARVRLLGALPHAALPALYGAADLLVLASSREGWANVLLEAMACGTAVIASDIPGNPEVVRAAEAGRIVANTPEAIAGAARAMLAAPPDRAATRAYAELFGWEETSAGQEALFRAVLARHHAGPVRACAGSGDAHASAGGHGLAR